MDKADDMLARYEELGKSPIPDFDVYWEDELVSEVRVGKTEVEVVRHVFHPVKQLFYADRISRYIFGEIIKNRCWDSSRGDIDDLLKSIGLTEFNPFEIVQKTHGKMCQDKIWFKFKGENLTYKELFGANTSK